MKCYSYKFNDTDQTACTGTFEQCKELVECPTESKSFKPVCFALAKLDDDGGTKAKILNAGCYSHDIVPETCNKQCSGYYRTSAKNYYCCCTETGCNEELIPKTLPPPFSPSTISGVPIHSSTPSWSDTENSDQILINQTVIFLVVVLALIVTVLFGAHYKRSLSRRRTDANIRINHAGGDVSVLMPFRNSFIDDCAPINNHHHHHHHHHLQPQLQQQLTSDNNILNDEYNTRVVNHNNPMNSNGLYQDASHLQQHQHQGKTYDLKGIELLEVVGSGRFGTVHRANLKQSLQQHKQAYSVIKNNNEVEPRKDDEHLDTISEIAVKIIPNNEYQSFQNEIKIYNSSGLRHPNLLTYMGSCESPQTNCNWLLVEYASNGSLHHYLKGNTISWDEFLRISLGIVKGLSYLHDADIVHRDFKSKNVLLRQDLSPCITDFGVAAMLDNMGGQRKKYFQVGTPRYMAPEVLECSVALTKTSFTKIDVYAASLVLWELLSRCHPLPKLKINDYNYLLTGMLSVNSSENIQQGSQEQDQQPLPSQVAEQEKLHLTSNDETMAQPLPYKVPFESIVGPCPDIDAMRQAVVKSRLRPQIRQEWCFYPIAKLCQAIVNGWEQDPEARVSASYFVERFEATVAQEQQQYNQQEHNHEQEQERGQEQRQQQRQQQHREQAQPPEEEHNNNQQQQEQKQPHQDPTEK